MDFKLLFCHSTSLHFMAEVQLKIHRLSRRYKEIHGNFIMIEEDQIALNNDLKKYNIAALLITPLWLLRNGFLISLIVYFIFLVVFTPVAIIISFIFFFKGNRWSWGNGNRWNSFSEFSENQMVWKQIAIILFVVQIVALLFYFKVI